MNKFRTTDIRYRIEDQLNWMLLTSYEIEMHLNAILYLANIFLEHGPLGNNYTLLWTSHDDLALIKTASILNKKRDKDEKVTLNGLSEFLNGNCINTNNLDIKPLFIEISGFYAKHTNISKFTKRRDTAAHAFKTSKEVAVIKASSVDFRTHLKIILEAREILQKLRIELLGETFENDSIDVHLFDKIYTNSLDIIIEQP